MTASAKTAPRELAIRDLDGQTATLDLDRDGITPGRSSANELSYPDDIGLSRQHLAIVRRNGQWTVEDLGSKSRTLLKGARVEKPMPFQPGDRISAGHLTIEFADPSAKALTNPPFDCMKKPSELFNLFYSIQRLSLLLTLSALFSLTLTTALLYYERCCVL